MEFWEYLQRICHRDSGSISKEDKRKYSFLSRRLFSAQFPIQCELINRLDVDSVAASTIVSLLASRYTGLPSFLKIRVDQTKRKESIRKYYEDCVIDKYMEINECGIREVEEAYYYDRDALDNAMKLIKKNFFNNKEKVIVKKITSNDIEEESTLF